MREWRLWERGAILSQVDDLRPLVASWERKTHPAQARLTAYLDELVSELGTPPPDLRLFLHMDVDVQEPKRLLRHYDLENYLTPVASRLGREGFAFVLVSATKRVGGGSRLAIGRAVPLDQTSESVPWEHFSCNAGAGAETPRWKANLRQALAAVRPRKLPEGGTEVRLAWRCSPRRNWVSLWKPTGDAMRPVLGEPIPDRPFSPNDDRIIVLGLHLNSDAALEHSVEVGMWWRLVEPR